MYIYCEPQQTVHPERIKSPEHYEIWIFGDHEVAVEVKSTEMAQPRHLNGLKSFAEEYNVKKMILVSNDPSPRKVGKIMIMPWKFFLDQLWEGGLIE